MTFTKNNSRTFMIGDEKNRVTALKELLGYPVVKRDPEGSVFWYLHPGEDEDEALETCPIAVGFYEQLNTATDQEIKRLLTSQEKQQEIYGHYSNREFEQQPVMYLLLPTEENSGRIPLVLPTEGGLRQRQIQTFGWNDAELIARLNRLKQEELTVATKALYSIPQVDWVFYEAAKTAGELASSLAEAARRIEQAEILADGHNLSNNTVNPILYRPFDKRFVVYDSKVVTRPRLDVMRHMMVGENLGLIARRQMIGELMSYFFVSKHIISDGVIRSDNKGGESIFPLYLYPNTNNPKELEEPIRPNLSSEFLKDITSKLGYKPTPEAIFYYIYAIFHSPTYRTRYAEFLKIDFPRVPLTSNDKFFQQLSAYGEELVALHLMKSSKLDNLITQFVENGGGKEVAIGTAKKAYANNKVTINKKGDGFTGVPQEVWNFHVGGYQVCHKWLKDRKKRILSQEDIQHYQRIVVALQETIKLMNKIDQAIPEFPIT